jgi:hypothetical protein
VPSAPPSPPLDPLRVHPLSNLVVAAGLRWVVFTRPQELLLHPALQASFSRFAPPVRRQVFQKLTGIGLDSIKEAVVAGYDGSTLFVLDGMADALETEARFRDRLIFDVIRKAYRSDAIWTHGRTATGDVRALSALHPHVVAVEGGDRLRSKVALLFALGRLRRSPRALDLPDMKQVLDALGDVPVRALAPGPFEGAWEGAIRGLLSSCSAVGLGILVGPAGQLSLSVRLAGAWGQDAPRAAEVLLSGWQDLASSSLGRLLHLDESTDGPRVGGGPEILSLDVGVDGVKLMDGLYQVVAADVREILDMDAPKETR